MRRARERVATMRTDVKGLSGDEALDERIRRQMSVAAGRLQVAPVAAQVSFFDEDGPKGGIAIRCAITVRVPYRPSVRVEHLAPRPRQAFDLAFGTLERQLQRYTERNRESCRHPKKYFAAERLRLAGRGTPRRGAGAGSRGSRAPRSR